MEFRSFNQNEDEPANGWTGETVRHALQQGKKLVVDQRGDIWELDQEGRQKEYCGKILRKEKQMSEYMNAKELAEMVSVSESKAYGFIRQMNEELTAKGYFIVRGKVPRKYARERFGVSE